MEIYLYKTFKLMTLAVKGIHNITYEMQYQAVEILVYNEISQREKMK